MLYNREPRYWWYIIAMCINTLDADTTFEHTHTHIVTEYTMY